MRKQNIKYQRWYPTYNLTYKDIESAYKFYNYKCAILEYIALFCVFASYYQVSLGLLAYLFVSYFRDSFSKIYILEDKEENRTE